MEKQYPEKKESQFLNQVLDQFSKIGINVDPRLINPTLTKLISRRKFLKIILGIGLASLLSVSRRERDLMEENIEENFIETTPPPTPTPTPTPEPTPTPTPTPEPTPIATPESILTPETKKIETQVIYRGPKNTKKVALTIDDTSDFGFLNYLLNLATQKNIKMVWFLIGSTVDLNEAELIKKALNTQLIRIGNHSLTHNIAKFSYLERAYLKEEIEGWIGRMKSLGIPEEELLRYFRPPGGAGGYNGGDPRLLNILSEIGYPYLCMWDIEFIWTIRTYYGGNYTLENILDILQKNIYGTNGGNLVLFHFNPVDLSAFEIITNQLLENNFQFVFPEELLG